MRYLDFKNRVRQYPVVTGGLLDTLDEDKRILHNQLSRWNKQGLLVQLKKGVYLLNPDDRAINPSKFFLANQLVFPSYVSLESALAYYHIIPESVHQITSVTTGKTSRHISPEGMFVFRHVKRSLFFGFDAVRDERGFETLLASPEKALLDFLYLNQARFSPTDSDIFVESYRFNGREVIRPARLRALAIHFESEKLEQIVKLFIKQHLLGKARA